MKPIRKATICHNDDNHLDPKHRRVKLYLRRTDRGYEWFCGEDSTDTGYYSTVKEAEGAAKKAWGGDVWSLRAKWL
jgi:hypothetical protein